MVTVDSRIGMLRLLAGTVAVIGFLCWGSAANANLVQNPGFDDPTPFNNWTVSPVSGSQIILDTNPGDAFSLPNSAQFIGDLSDTSTLSQSLATTPGLYNLSFELLNSGATPLDINSTFTVTLSNAGGTDLSRSFTAADVFVQPNSNNAYNLEDPSSIPEFGSILLTGADTLTFTGINDPGTTSVWNLDDVSLTPVSVSAVPEPPGALLLGTALIGLFGIAAVRRRHKNSAEAV